MDPRSATLVHRQPLVGPRLERLMLPRWDELLDVAVALAGEQLVLQLTTSVCSDSEPTPVVCEAHVRVEGEGAAAD